ncbi:MAG TPA: ribonuclease P protein component [Brevefilum sp.]|nr:ribonuclease P protein component [Brevefilum sp.]HOR19820.1 ribonuclease P protein component [Brevefilum sp.]HPL68875.1 ribonuclease P protein component [Brevefilum sp.]
MQHRLRLTRNDEINRVRQDGQTLANTNLVLGFLPNQLKQNRIAIIAGRSIGGAVQRNFAKRRLRSAIQSLVSEFDQGFDMVLIARKPILTVNYALIVTGLRDLAQDAGLLKDELN